MTKLSWLLNLTVHSCLMATAHAAYVYSFQLTYYCWYLRLSLLGTFVTLFPHIGNLPGQYFTPLHSGIPGTLLSHLT